MYNKCVDVKGEDTDETIWKQTWRHRLAAALIQLLMVLAMAGVGIRMPVQAAEKNAVTQSGEMKVHSST